MTLIASEHSFIFHLMQSHYRWWYGVWLTRSLLIIARECRNTKRNMNNTKLCSYFAFSKIFLFVFRLSVTRRLLNVYRLFFFLFISIFSHFFFSNKFFSMFQRLTTITTTTNNNNNHVNHWMCGWIVGNTFDRTVVRIVIRRFTQAIECGDIWCGCDYEHIWCNDELLRFICGSVAERVLLSQSCHCRFVVVLTWTGIDLTCKKYAAHFGHIQCHQWWVNPHTEFSVVFSAAVSFHMHNFASVFRWLLFEELRWWRIEWKTEWDFHHHHLMILLQSWWTK